MVCPANESSALTPTIYSSSIWVEDNSKVLETIDKVPQNNLAVSSLMTVLLKLPPVVS